MTLDETIQNKLSRKVNRQIELEAGRISFNRIHKDKKKDSKYQRKNFKNHKNKFGGYIE